MKYIFMVGFPRSGTTLAQSIVMCDDQVFSIPETHIFTRGIRFTRLPEPLSNIWTSWYCYRWIKKNFSENYICYNFSKKEIIKSFFLFLEKKAEKERKSIILEKTPSHLKHIEYISSIFKNAVFIHVTRSYTGAVPSIVRAAKLWGGNTNILTNMAQWLADTFTSIHYSKTLCNHVVIDYYDIVEKRKNVVDKINNLLGLNIKNVTDKKLAKISKIIVQKDETWKVNNVSGFRKPVSQSNLNFDEPLEFFIDYLNSIKHSPVGNNEKTKC